MPTLHTYDDAFKFLLEFTDYEKVTKYKYNIATFNLQRVEALMEAVGSPHRAFRCAHVAGTKGKGSTSTLIQSVLTAAGLRTGLFTSPHLTRLEERMTIDGRMMSEAELIEIVNELHPYTAVLRRVQPNESPTFFELVTAAGFRHFQRQKVDFASIEVGMGGRLDATNVILPEVSVITRLDFDHVERLGDTLAKIAFEKAGIIKHGRPVVCAPQAGEALDVVRRVSAERGCALTELGRDYCIENVRTGMGADNAPFCSFDLAGPARRYRELRLGMLGAHQAINAATAVAAVEMASARCGLNIGEDAIRRGLESARIPARLEVFPGAPPLLLDGAHNPASVRALCQALDDAFPGQRIVLVMGVSRDKNAEEMLPLLLPRASAAIFTRSDSPRAREPQELADLARDLCGFTAEVHDDAFAALDRARALAGPQDLLCITGSFFLAGKLRPGLSGECTGHVRSAPARA